MSEKLKLSVSPHIHSGNATYRIMLDVLIALLPATVLGTVIFGLRSLAVIAACVASCVLFEFLFNLVTKREQTVGDLSAAVTGLILALGLPSTTPIWQCVVGAVFAIIVVKALFGGIGANIVNPAVAALVFMLVSFGTGLPNMMDEDVWVALWVKPTGTIGGAGACAPALLLGAIYLLIRRVISWQTPVCTLATVFLLSFLSSGDAMAALAYTLTGGTLLAAVFMATDCVTTPITAWGKVIFGVGTGLIAWLIRDFGIYTEGVLFAILLMNILTPYIDVWTRRRIFGEKRGGGRA